MLSRLRKNASSDSAYDWPVSRRSKSAPDSARVRSSAASNAAARLRNRSRTCRSPVFTTRQFSALRVPERDQPDVGQLPLPGIGQLNGDEVVAPREPGQRSLVAGAQKIRNEEDDRAAADHRLEVAERRAEIGAGARGPEGEQVADDAERLPPPLPRGHVVLHLVGREDRAHPVVVPRGRQREHGAHLGGQIPLGAAHAAEARRGAQIGHEEHGQLALLEVALDVGRAQPSGDVPVDGADVVAGLVLAHFGELHAAAAECAGVLAGHDVAHEVAGGDLESPHLARDFLRTHGTGTASRMRRTTASAPMPSASAR